MLCSMEKKKFFLIKKKNVNRGIMVLLLPSHTSSFSSDITYPGEQIEMGTSVPIGKLPEDGHGDGQVQDA